MKGVEEREEKHCWEVWRNQEHPLFNSYGSSDLDAKGSAEDSTCDITGWFVLDIQKQAWMDLLSSILTYIYRETMLYVQIKRASSKDLTFELMLQHWKLVEHMDFEIIEHCRRKRQKRCNCTDCITGKYWNVWQMQCLSEKNRPQAGCGIEL